MGLRGIAIFRVHLQRVLLIFIILFSLIIIPIQGVQQDIRLINSGGSIVYIEPLSWLHTEGKQIKNEQGEVVLLRGVMIYEVTLFVDHLRNNDPINVRIARLKELGVNHVRIPITKTDWDVNKDTNNDGIGARDFIYQLIDEFTDAGIYVFVGLHFGVDISDEQAWASDPQIVVDFYNNNIINRYRNNPGVNIYIWNEPHHGVWGGEDIGGGITRGFWDAMQTITSELHNLNPNMLMVVHGDTWASEGISSILRTEPISVPNIVYTFHYYYLYGPAFEPYEGWLSGIPDPDYSYLVEKGKPFYQSYAAGNFEQAKLEFEQYLYDEFLWVTTELDLPIISDEFGFNDDEIPYFSLRACAVCLLENGGVPQRDLTFWKISDTYSNPELSIKKTSPFTGTVYCPICGAELTQPQPYSEPGWPQVMRDFIEILEKYNSSWTQFAWWPKNYAGYGLTTEDMHTLSVIGEIWRDYLNR